MKELFLECPNCGLSFSSIFFRGYGNAGNNHYISVSDCTEHCPQCRSPVRVDFSIARGSVYVGSRAILLDIWNAPQPAQRASELKEVLETLRSEPTAEKAEALLGDPRFASVLSFLKAHGFSDIPSVVAMIIALIAAISPYLRSSSPAPIDDSRVEQAVQRWARNVQRQSYPQQNINPDPPAPPSPPPKPMAFTVKGRNEAGELIVEVIEAATSADDARVQAKARGLVVIEKVRARP